MSAAPRDPVLRLDAGVERLDFTIAPRVEEVLRLLGRKHDYSPGPLTSRLVDEILPLSAALAAPRAVVGAWPRASLRELAMPSALVADADRVALAAVTIGARLEEEVSAWSARGDLARATVLDACGSDMAEASAARVAAEIALCAPRLGLAAACRQSPGYGAWGIEAQGPLLALLGADRIGIRLTSAHAMTPQKSISFAATLVRSGAVDAGASFGASSCDDCGLSGCSLRRSKGDAR